MCIGAFVAMINDKTININNIKTGEKARVYNIII